MEFIYSNIVHLLTQKMPFFANYGLCPGFNFQGVNKIVNPITKNWALWLVNSWAFDLCLTLKNCKDEIRKMLMNIVNNNQTSRLETKFGFDDIILK